MIANFPTRQPMIIYCVWVSGCFCANDDGSGTWHKKTIPLLYVLCIVTLFATVINNQFMWLIMFELVSLLWK